MKILAVIPACEGSLVFPNKNIRIVNGKPLIYYVIYNAKQSKYITDIIVTTNSDEIINIAKQMGVKTKLRDDFLCNVNTSLDTVVYDVVNDFEVDEFDYVVTMQSISPTLKVTTLDAAIEQCILDGFDTTISVCPFQKYFWEKQDVPLPLRDVRVNRNKLKPLYAETGAFLISKREFITEKTRIGNNVNLYELNADEAVDVYCFGDLKQVENILGRKSVAIYVNGNNSIGLGHIYRVIQLADELFSRPDIYFDKNQTDVSSFGKTTHNLVPVDGIDGLFSALRGRSYDIFINDILSTNRSYMRGLKEILPNCRIVNFEDEGTGAALADVVFNALYEEEHSVNVKAGEKYFIASKLFLLHKPVVINETVKNILVTFGGADPQNYTEKMLDIILAEKYKNYDFYVVLGKAKNNIDSIISKIKNKNIHFMHNISNMAEVMSKCDIAFTSRGRTGFELVFMGVPTVSIAQNSREERHNFLCEDNGVTYLGFNPSVEVIQRSLDAHIYMSKNERESIQRKMLAKDLRNGRKNVMNIILNL